MEIRGASLSKWCKWLAERTSRDTSSGQFIPAIDGLRFVAIFSVIFCHLGGFAARKMENEGLGNPVVVFLLHGGVGVQLFFVISGFIIALPFAKAYFEGSRPPVLRRYYLRRLTRLEPPYILNLLICFPVVHHTLHMSVLDLIPHLAASMFYLHNQIYGAMSAINLVAWSLEIELQFYVLAPLVASVFRIRSKARRRVLLVSLIALCSLLFYAFGGTERFRLSILAHAHLFLTGFLLVDVYLSDWKTAPNRSFRWDAVSVAAWVAIGALLYAGRTGEAALAAPIFLAYYAAFRGPLSNRFFCNRVVYTIGGMCYTTYLYHFVVIFASIRIVERTGVLSGIPFDAALVIEALVIVPLILLVSAAMFILVEKPCMRRDWHLALLDRVRSALPAPRCVEPPEPEN